MILALAWACGTPAVTETAPSPAATPDPPSVTGAGADTTTSTTPANSAPTEGAALPAAPDFTLALGSGGTFRLYDETRPVYLVFWAEW